MSEPMNTPERINLPGGWHFKYAVTRPDKQDWYTLRTPAGFSATPNDLWTKEQAEAFAAAMQPPASHSAVELATTVIDALSSHESVQFADRDACLEPVATIIQAALSSREAPASRDAVGLSRTIANQTFICAGSGAAKHKALMDYATPRIQAYGDARVEEYKRHVAKNTNV